ncbi:hypothetical protein D3C81_1312260 [compost metagenome]
MQQRHAPVLPNPLAVGNVDHSISRHSLGVFRQAMHQQVAGVTLVEVVRLHPSPRVALHALDDALGKVVVLPGQIVRLQQLQGEGDPALVVVTGHAPFQHLRHGLAVTQPGTAHQALDLRPGQLAGDLRL